MNDALPERPGGRLRAACSLPALAGLLLLQAVAGVELAEDGVGEALIYPFLYAGEGAGAGERAFDSLIQVSNLDLDWVVLRAILRDGRSGAAVLSWNLRLASFDRWTAALTRSDGTLALVTDDGSCIDLPLQDTVGGLPAHRFEAQAPHLWLELIRLGSWGLDLPPDDRSLWNSPRRTCEFGVWPRRLVPSDARLRGEAQLIDVPRGLSFRTDVVALTDLRLPLPGGPEEARELDLDAAAPLARLDGVETTWRRGIDAVGAVLTVAHVTTTFSALASLNGRTDLVLTFPTRHYYSEGEGPFPITSRPEHPEVGTELKLAVADREGLRVDLEATYPKCSPAPPPARQAGPVVSDAQASLFASGPEDAPIFAVRDREPVSVLADGASCGPVYARLSEFGIDEGTVTLDLSDYAVTSVEGHRVTGLPVLVQSLSVVANGTLADAQSGRALLANYGLTNAVQRFRAEAERADR